ncbi:MAG TPA: acyltransferase [Candidatus Sulfotelmatobacter sp.]|nr:acyltransferase [Candidatus Sulfotelmatobacter sp.]HEV2470095.1 acyltransferase [Candidatus Sulfotelmatobacter sp.]
MVVPEAAPYPVAWKRLDGIDLLRGLSIFFVLMNHINIRLLGADVPYTNLLPAQLVHILVWNGQLGVQMFFAISGFLITSITIRRWNSLPQVSLRGFYQFRFARIAPLLFLLLGVLCALHFTGLHHYVVTAETGGLGRALLAAVTLHLNELEIHRGYLPGNWDILWSLSIEEAFYLFFPLACLLLAGKKFFGRNIVFPALLFIFVALGPFGRTLFAHGNEIAEDYSYLGGMEGIALGCLTALAVSSGLVSRRAISVLWMPGTLIVSASIIFSWQAYRGWLGKTGLNFTLLGLGTCMFIAGTTAAEWTSPRVLRPLLRMGRYSYEIYLTHMFVVFTFFDLFLHACKPMRGVAFLFVCTIVVAGLLGAGIANLYSEPANRILRGIWTNQSRAARRC